MILALAASSVGFADTSSTLSGYSIVSMLLPVSGSVILLDKSKLDDPVTSNFISG